MTNNNTRENVMSFENTIGGKLLKNLEEAAKACIVVPNSWLPEDYHDNVRGGRTLKRLDEMNDRREGLSTHVKLKALKARNVERMAAQVTEGQTDIDKPLDWSKNETDEIAQYSAECALVAGMVSGGLIDADDLLEG